MDHGGYSVFKFSGHINCPILKWKKLIILYQEVASACYIVVSNTEKEEGQKKESPRGVVCVRRILYCLFLRPTNFSVRYRRPSLSHFPMMI